MDTKKLKVREALAAYAHEAWAGWMKYLFSLTVETGDGCEEIQAPQVRRWQRQMRTIYCNLPEKEKVSDLAEADKILDILYRYERSFVERRDD